ncbi:MAG: diaminopimelate decarboxylase [Deltaproteobacteria bacterium]|nr:diaminopimelate decarboxylase [Deltaproteobacteria bacterium]MBI4224076.1 diaminopimelate decarboxylase [Deltaproteobacteria bacterium]
MKNDLAKTLAKKYGTPLYVYDAERIRENYRRLHKAFSTRWPDFQIFYAVKSNSNPAVVQILLQEGAGCDCASENELKLAMRLRVPAEKILFSGNMLADADLKAGLESKALFNLDDTSLLPRLLKFGRPEVLSFRINPAIGKSNVHESDELAGAKAKFGIPWEKAEAAYALAKEKGLKRFGVHMMTGSCVTDPAYFAKISEKLLNCVGPIGKKLKIDFEFINIGGGFGIPYQPNEKPLDIEKTASLVVEIFKKKTKEFGLSEVKLFVEPGRYLVGDAGCLVGRVHAIKESYKKFVGTDVGMNILARPVLYGAYHGIRVVKCSNGTTDHGPRTTDLVETVTVTGQACENADAWAKDRKLPKLEVGDLIVVENAGAYGYVMSYPYNGRLRAAEVLLEKNQPKLIRKREAFEDWMSGTTLFQKG